MVETFRPAVLPEATAAKIFTYLHNIKSFRLIKKSVKISAIGD